MEDEDRLPPEPTAYMPPKDQLPREGVYDPSMWPTGRRRYLMSMWPHTLLSTGRLHSERMSFNNFQHMLYYWAYQLYLCAFYASLAADDPNGNEKHRREEWATVAREAEMVVFLAEAAEVSPQVGSAMIHRSIDAGREAALYWLEMYHAECDDRLDDEQFYPWFIPGYWGTGDDDAQRAADLAELSNRLADKLGIPFWMRDAKIELEPGERWY